MSGSVWQGDLAACARLVEQGDPVRFAAAMAAPEPARRVLFPIYACNVEISRAPWVSAEPMIAQMRLQWWADVLQEIASGGPVRRHEVTTPLAQVLTAEGARQLARLVEARRVDVEPVPFDDEAALLAYFDLTAGALACSAVSALGGRDGGDVVVTAFGRAAGLVRYFQAVPALEARSKVPLPDGRPETLTRLAQGQLDALRKLAPGGLRGLRKRLGSGPDAAVLEFWQTRALLRAVVRDPMAVAEGRLALSGFGDKARLLLAAAF